MREFSLDVSGWIDAELDQEVPPEEGPAAAQEPAAPDLGGIQHPVAVTIDAELVLKDVTQKTYRDLQALWPFGEENPEPRFLLRNAPIEKIRAVGNSAKHLKLRLGGVDAIAFGFGKKASELRLGDRLDLVASLSENTWNGKTAIELNVVDLVKS